MKILDDGDDLVGVCNGTGAYRELITDGGATMVRERKTYGYFQKAFSFLMATNTGKIKNTDLATAVGVSKQHLSEVRTGRKKASGPLQEAIAEHFGYSLVEFLEYGKKLSVPAEPFPGHAEIAKIADKATKIASTINAAAATQNISGLMRYGADELTDQTVAGFPTFIQSFWRGEISLTELYNNAVVYFQKMKAHLVAEARKFDAH